MSFRITTNGLLRNYRNNLYDNTHKVNNSMERVQTGRQFNSYAEDPAAASKAFQLRRSFWNTGNQIDNSQHIISKFQTGWDALDAIVEGDGDVNRGLNGITASIRALNGPSGSSRHTLGTDLLTTAESVTMLMNTRYNDEYVFAGADGLNVPFTTDDQGNLLYRGVMVDAPRAMTEDEYNAARTANDPAVADLASYKAYQEDYVGKYVKEPVMDKTDSTKVDTDMSFKKAILRYDEATYVDIGLGLKMDSDQNVVSSSAFNSALSGMDMLGYGLDEDGDPKNIVSIMKELGTIYQSCDTESGDYAEYTYNGETHDAEYARERAGVLTQKLYRAFDHVSEKHVELDSKSKYLQDNKTQLETTQATLNEQIADTEALDMAESILEMSWARYCYEAALKIGNSILSQSLIDYLR